MSETIDQPKDERSGSTVCSPADLCKNMGCRERNGNLYRYFILDGFDPEFYLIFDASEDPETPEAKGKVDIIVADIGSHPNDSESKRRVAINVGSRRLAKFMFALDVTRFSEKTQRALFSMPHYVR